MADTLLFRGGSSASIDVASIQSRELAIDTDTDQIVSGPSRKKTVMEDSNGDVEIGGGNIELNADGSIDAAGQLFISQATTNDEARFLKLQLSDATASGQKYAVINATKDGVGTQNLRLKAIITDITNNVTVKGNVLIGGTLPSAPNTKLNSDGSATFSGSVSIGGTGAANTIDEYEEGTCTVDLTVGGDAAGLTGGNAQGTYTRIGDIVIVQINLNITPPSVSGLTGNLSITGLPFAAENNTRSNYFTAACSVTNWATDYANGSKTIMAICSANSTTISLLAGSRSTGQLTESALSFSGGSCRLSTTFTYRIA